MILSKHELQQRGYRVENMGHKWPMNYAGKFRWYNVRTGKFQSERSLSNSEQSAWIDASNHETASFTRGAGVDDARAAATEGVGV